MTLFRSPMPEDEVGAVPMAFVVLPAGIAVAGIAKFMAKEASHYKQPKTLQVIYAIAKSASGKILRRMLKDRVAAR